MSHFYYEDVEEKDTLIYIPPAYNAYDTATGKMYITYGKTDKICGEILCEKKIEEIKKMFPKYFK